MTVINPFVDNLNDLKDTEIENKIQDLSKKYWMVANPNVKMKIANLLEIYKQEITVRRAQAWDQQNQKRNKDLDNLIQIN